MTEEFSTALGLSLAQESIYRAGLEFARRVVGPAAEEMDRLDQFPTEVWAALGEQGYLGLGIPEDYGGSGGDLTDAALVGRALARASPALALSYGAHLNLCAHNILRSGTLAQKQRFLPDLAAGRTIGALALTEPDAGSDATSIRCEAVAAEGGYRLRGSKMFITNGPIADIFVVYAKTRPEAGKDGISAFIVPGHAPGVRVARTLEKLGMRGSPTGEIVFEDCFVPKAYLLGEENRGILVMMRGLDVERAFYAFTGVGVAEESLEMALRYAMERKQFGRPIAEFELIQAKIADMYVGTEAARLLALQAVRAVAEGRRASREAAAALLFASEAARKAVDEALQIHGGYGFLRGSILERFYRDAKLFDIGAGTQEIRRILLARELTGQR